MVLPSKHGLCVWCDGPTGAKDLDDKSPESAPPAPLKPHIKRYTPICPDCGGKKSEASTKCMDCRRASKWRGKAPLGKQPATCISEELITEAYRLYQQGMSLRAVAAKLFKQTSYSSPKSATNGIHQQFVRRGWPLRDRKQLMSERNFRHGKATRAGDKAAYKRWARAAKAAPCSAVKQNAPRKGHPCSLNAMKGSQFCYMHNPQNKAKLESQLAQMRERIKS